MNILALFCLAESWFADTYWIWLLGVIGCPIFAIAAIVIGWKKGSKPSMVFKQLGSLIMLFGICCLLLLVALIKGCQ